MTLLSKSFLLFIYLFSSGIARSHDMYIVNGRIVDSESAPISFANVILLKASDSSFVSGTISNDEGGFDIQIPQEGFYILEVSMIGFHRFQSEIFRINNSVKNLDFGSIQLVSNTNLQEVEVVARKQMFEQAIDRLVINVENAISFAGGTALDVLENAPGIIVDRQNETLSLAGKDGVQVMINGRIKYVPAAALIQMLQGMSADNISKIEIITTPPSNLDAEGNAGYINLVLKSSPDDGTSGSVSVNAGYGRGFVGGLNVSINARKARWNWYGDYSINYSDRPQLFDFLRANVYEGNNYSLSTTSDRRFIANNQSGRVGFDYELSSKTILGGMVSGYNNHSVLAADGYTEFGKEGGIDTIIILRNDLISLWQHLSGNLNLVHKFNEKSALSLDVDYLYYREINPANYVVDYFDPDNNSLFTNNFRTSKNTPINTFVSKVDYEYRYSDKISFETGAKLVQSRFVNDLSIETFEQDFWILDPELSGMYDLDEKIAAGYVSFSMEFDPKTSLKAGLRYEHTWSVLSSEEQQGLIDRNYGNWFPSVFVSRKIDSSNSLNLAYSKRIRRQTFNDLAPFVLFMDPFSFWSGNEALQPSFSDNLSFGFKHQSILLIVQYTYEDNSIMRYQGKIDSESNRMTLVSENLDFMRTFNTTLSLPWTVNKYWEMQNNFQVNLRDAVFFYEGNGVYIKQNTWSVNTTQRFKLPHRLSLELTGQYRSADLRGQFIALPYYGMNIGIQKKLKGNHGNLRFNVSDVFDSFVFRTRNSLNEQGLVMVGDWDFSQRTFRLTYSRNFGSSGVKKARQKAESEERSRVE